MKFHNNEDENNKLRQKIDVLKDILKKACKI
jgi:hypothetical protein